MTYYAHTGIPDWQPLAEHLREVACRARVHGAPLGLADEAELAGLLHDLGKYARRFQQRLRSPATVSGVNHWAAGAYLASQGKHPLAAFAIDGHHTGIPAHRSTGAGESMEQTLAKFADASLRTQLTACPESGADLQALARADGLALPLVTSTHTADKFANAMRVRLLFSCLVDADFFDTEQHFDKGKPSLRETPPLQAERALELLDQSLRGLPSAGNVNQLRARLLADCRRCGAHRPGLFTLTAPTGSGKTLASLAFALNHIAHHNSTLAAEDPTRFRRIIVVIPFTSIIEQTARVYRGLFAEALGDDFVLEHHSAVAPVEQMSGANRDAVSDSTMRARLAQENWAAPLVVTTNVQFFHSLFSNKPSACRKLHNIGRSVILFDEVQTLKPQLVPSLLSGVQLLVRDYGCSAVFMTATQPAFASAQAALPYEWKPVEISSDPEAMAHAFRRTRIELPAPDASVTREQLAAQIASHPQALCVVNTTADARTLFKLLPEGGRFHLSSRLCPAHRQQQLQQIRERLHLGKPCRLVSTQLIEAGVDVDFPIAWRALGPLDSIIQTAGRCNREGRHGEPRPVIVFRPAEGGHLPFEYKQVKDITESFLHGLDGESLQSPATYRDYFQRLYAITGRDKAEADEAFKLSCDFDFPAAAKACRLIEDNTRSVLVKWGEGAALIAKLEMQKHLTRDECRLAQRYSVNLYHSEFMTALAHGWVYQITDGWELYAWNSNYDDDLGACHLTGADLTL